MSSFGQELKRERELRQITLREISEATKINIRYLDALERNEFRHLPGGVFNKGFVRAYAQFIGVDPESMVNAYILEERHQEIRTKARQDATPVHPARLSTAPARARAKPRGRARSGTWTLVSLLLLLLAAGVLAGIFVLWGKRGAAGARNGNAVPPNETTLQAAGDAEKRT